jgi:hypothetical protein
MENDTFKSFDTDKDLLALKKEETLLVKEFQRIIDFFNRTLLLKEKIRIALMEKIINSEKLRNEIFEKLKRIVRNIEIYDKNLEQLDQKKRERSMRESRIKGKYEEILHSSSSTQLLALGYEESEIFGDICQELLNISRDLQNIGKTTKKEELMKCRQEYMQGLQKLFQKMDEELVAIDKEKEKIKRFHLEIKKKKDKAVKQQTALKKNYNLLVEDVKTKKVGLEISVQEEKTLIAEYRKLIGRIQASLKAIGDIEQILEKVNASSEILDSAADTQPIISIPQEEIEFSDE